MMCFMHIEQGIATDNHTHVLQAKQSSTGDSSQVYMYKCKIFFIYDDEALGSAKEYRNKEAPMQQSQG